MPFPSALAAASRDTLLAQIGTPEYRQNSGPVQKYWKKFSRYPIPYCQAGQEYCIDHAAKPLGVPGDVYAFMNTASTITAWYGAVKIGKKTAYKSHVDDLIYWRSGKAWSGHVERIIAILTGGWVRTVGFNTSCGGGDEREGSGVCIKKRNIFHPLGRLRILGLIGLGQ